MKIFLICVLGLFLGYILFYEVFEWQYRNGIRKIDINEERKEMIVEAYPIEIDVEDWTFYDFPNHLNEKNKTNGISIFNGKEKCRTVLFGACGRITSGSETDGIGGQKRWQMKR